MQQGNKASNTTTAPNKARSRTKSPAPAAGIGEGGAGSVPTGGGNQPATQQQPAFEGGAGGGGEVVGQAHQLLSTSESSAVTIALFKQQIARAQTIGEKLIALGSPIMDGLPENANPEQASVYLLQGYLDRVESSLRTLELVD